MNPTPAEKLKSWTIQMLQNEMGTCSEILLINPKKDNPILLKETVKRLTRALDEVTIRTLASPPGTYAELEMTLVQLKTKLAIYNASL